MSSPLKIFIDRFSDLITTHRDIGRGLRGRKTYLLATGTDNALPPGFEKPFELTSKYFDMEFRGSLYLPFECEEGITDKMKKPCNDFVALLTKEK
jgi:hypothetical protein